MCGNAKFCTENDVGSDLPLAWHLSKLIGFYNQLHTFMSEKQRQSKRVTT